MLKADILEMTDECLPISGENEWLLVLEQIRQSDPMYVAHNVMIHAVDEEECT
jgi:hypothetical protein